jgi:hypothetical protein
MISSSPTVDTALKTAVFKLHNPSRRKRAMLDHALLHNHLAYNKALKSLARLFGCRGASSEKDLSAQERKSMARQRKWKRQSLLVKK